MEINQCVELWSIPLGLEVSSNVRISTVLWLRGILIAVPKTPQTAAALLTVKASTGAGAGGGRYIKQSFWLGILPRFSSIRLKRSSVRFGSALHGCP